MKLDNGNRYQILQIQIARHQDTIKNLENRSASSNKQHISQDCKTGKYIMRNHTTWKYII